MLYWKSFELFVVLLLYLFYPPTSSVNHLPWQTSAPFWLDCFTKVMQLIRCLSQKSLHLLYIGCFIIFVVQMSFLVYNRIHPSQTISSTKQKQLAEIDFPLVFKICIKPAYNAEQLNRAGYSSAWDYFVGCSKYNGYLMGWAGHTEDGKAVSNVSGCIN